MHFKSLIVPYYYIEGHQNIGTFLRVLSSWFINDLYHTHTDDKCSAPDQFNYLYTTWHIIMTSITKLLTHLRKVFQKMLWYSQRNRDP